MSPKKTGSGRRSGLQDSTGSASGTANTEDIPLDELEDGKFSLDSYDIAYFKKASSLNVYLCFSYFPLLQERAKIIPLQNSQTRIIIPIFHYKI